MTSTRRSSGRSFLVVYSVGSLRGSRSGAVTALDRSAVRFFPPSRRWVIVRGIVFSFRECLYIPAEPHVVLAANVGRLSVAETLKRIHMPARPCPGTAQKIMYDPGLLATNFRESDSPAARPCISRTDIARANAGGSTGPAGIGLVVSTTSAE